MTVQQTRWFAYDEPTGNERVEAEIRTVYQTGPNEPSREDDVTIGTVGYEALEMMDEDEEIQRHTHEDFSVLLSGLSAEKEQEFLKTFQEDDQ